MSTKTPTEITVDFVLTAAQKLGLDLTLEDKSWYVFQDKKSQHKLCVSKTKGQAPKIDTTVDITSMPGVLARGVDTDPNGRFVSLFIADGALIEAALKQMATGDSLRPVRRAAKKAPVAFRLESTEESAKVELHPLSGLEA